MGARGPKKGTPRTGGRQKGTPNKLTTLAKDAIAQAAEGLGGTNRLIAWAKSDDQNERVFWGQIYTKLLPLQLTGENGTAIQHEHKVTRVEIVAAIDNGKN
jgi:hypothetical protein